MGRGRLAPRALAISGQLQSRRIRSLTEAPLPLTPYSILTLLLSWLVAALLGQARGVELEELAELQLQTFVLRQVRERRGEQPSDEG